MKNKTALIIDGNHAAHRASHSMARMSYKGRSTSVIFGLLNIIGGVSAVYKPKKMIVCWDDGRHPERMKIHPGYKKRDPKVDFDYEDFHKQNEATRKMINYLGVPQLIKKNHEADDLIYVMSRKLVNKGYKVIIVSGDKDFNQLVCKDIFIHNPNKGLINPVNFKKLVGVDSPDQFVDYLSLTGDSSDCIPGVRGIGEVRALEFLSKWGSVKHFATVGLKDPSYDRIIEGTGLSRALIDLKWFYKYKFKEKIDASFYYLGQKKCERKLKKYLKKCAYYGLNKWAKEEFTSKIP